MWIQVRTIDGKVTRTVEDLSRLTKIESLRLKIQDIFNVSPQQQRLFYRGKQVNNVRYVAPGRGGCFALFGHVLPHGGDSSGPGRFGPV